MLTGTSEVAKQSVAGTIQSGLDSSAEPSHARVASGIKQSTFAKMLRVEWLGQTVASLCWIVSVFAYGITSAGDWLQLCAASAWLVANIAAIAPSETD